jgi:hypothetical protein
MDIKQIIGTYLELKRRFGNDQETGVINDLR